MDHHDQPHWLAGLYGLLPRDQEVTVPVTVHAGQDSSAAKVIASRIAGIVSALRPPHLSPDPADDPLANEDTHDLRNLLHHLHQVRVVMETAEDRLILLLRHRGISLRNIATYLDVHHQTVENRVRRIERAAALRLNAAGHEDLSDPLDIATNTLVDRLAGPDLPTL